MRQGALLARVLEEEKKTEISPHAVFELLEVLPDARRISIHSMRWYQFHIAGKSDGKRNTVGFDYYTAACELTRDRANNPLPPLPFQF